MRCRHVCFMNCTKIPCRLFSKSFLIGTGRERINQCRYATIIIVHLEISRCDYWDLLSADTKDFSQHSNEVPTVLGCGGHQNVIFEKCQEFRTERPTFHNLLLKSRLIGMWSICMQ